MDRMPVITIHTSAYNVESYIRECAESILDQSFLNFEWVVLDNGCTDKTSKILEEYSDRDKRVKLFKNDINNRLPGGENNPHYTKYLENLKSEYICYVDSDDYLHLDFLKVLYEAAKGNGADIAVGGTKMFMDENPEVFGTRCPPDFFINNISMFGDILPEIYGSFRPMWGKLFKVSLVNQQKEMRKEKNLRLKNAGDTLFCLDCLSLANSVVGINKVLHFYRIRQDSLYHSQVDKERYLDYLIIYNQSKELLQRWGKLQTNNEVFITGVLYGSIKDCIDAAVKNGSESIDKRIEVIESILSDQFIYQIIMKSEYGGSLIEDTYNGVIKLMGEFTDKEWPSALGHFVIRLFRSIYLINSSDSNKHNALLLYLSAICDEKNKFRFGSKLLYSLLTQFGFSIFTEIEKMGVSSSTLASNPILLRELINSNFKQAAIICEENQGDIEYELLGNLLNKATISIDFEQLIKAKEMVANHINGEQENNKINDNIVETLLTILEHCPLDREALYYKLFLLASSGDILTALETVEVMNCFYPEDSTLVILEAKVLGMAERKDKAIDLLEKSLHVCKDEEEQKDLKETIEYLETI